MLGEGRKMVLRDKETGDFYDDFTTKDRGKGTKDITDVTLPGC